MLKVHLLEETMKIKLLFLASCLLVIQTAGAHEFGNWVVEGGSASVTNESGSLLGVFCTPIHCDLVLYLAGNFPCKTGKTYPFMINSDSGVTFTRGACQYIPKVGPAYKLKNWQQILPALAKDDEIGFAVALLSGSFAVVHFSLLGSAAALNALGAQFQPSNPARSQLHDSIM
jgi:hypothetical protein